MTTLQPTAAPVRPFLDWPVVTDPSGWAADVAVFGIQHSEPYSHDPRPNDQSRAPDAIRWQSQRFCYAPAHWDFDTGTDQSLNRVGPHSANSDHRHPASLQFGQTSPANEGFRPGKPVQHSLHPPDIRKTMRK